MVGQPVKRFGSAFGHFAVPRQSFFQPLHRNLASRRRFFRHQPADVRESRHELALFQTGVESHVHTRKAPTGQTALRNFDVNLSQIVLEVARALFQPLLDEYL